MSSTQNNNSTEKLRYLALGDSYTIGESVEVEKRWPVQLVDALTQIGYKISSPKIIAKTGWTTGELKEAILSEKPSDSYQLVSLLIGVNNQYRKLDTLEYRKEFKELLQMAVSFAGDNVKNVLVVSIPDYGITPFAKEKNPSQISSEINIFNAINFEETVKAGVKYVNITQVSRKAEHEPELLAEDGLHPSGKMYAEWVKLILPEAQKIILN